jgi:putative ABC transport system permease protein
MDSQHLSLPAGQRMALYERSKEVVRALPDVEEVALSLITPVQGGGLVQHIEISGGMPVPNTLVGGNSFENIVSPGWFSSLGTRLIAGRDFTEHDGAGTPRVAIVNEAIARKFLNGASPLGRSITQLFGGPIFREPIEIVGLVSDAAYDTLDDPMPPTVYLPVGQFAAELPADAQGMWALNVRSRTDAPAALTRSIAAAIGSVDPQLVLTFRTLTDQVNASVTQERIVAMLSAFFGGLALLLAGVGLYGVTAYSVSQRRPEIGIRMALGAAPGGIVRLVLARVVVLVAIGVALGTMASLWASQFVASLLFGLTPHDPETVLGAAIILSAVGTLAAWVPARRAGRLDPAVTLRSE